MHIRDDAPFVMGCPFVGNLLQDIVAATSNVHLGPVGGKSSSDHKADACPTTGDDGNAALEVEDAGSVEIYG